LRPDKDVPSDDKIKAMGFEMVSELFEEVKASIQANTTKLARINKERPDAASEKLAPFVMSEKTLNSLQILEEIPCDFEDWEELIKESKWATRILKIWFSLLKNFSIVHKWAKWPEILNDVAFRSKAVKEVENEIEELDSYL
jgi:hypothetical protein